MQSTPMPKGSSSKPSRFATEVSSNDAVWQLLRDNIRVSDLVVGDMEAQIAVARIGAERLGGLIERYIESHLPLRVSRRLPRSMC
jgi:N-methylhydantoinase B